MGVAGRRMDPAQMRRFAQSGSGEPQRPAEAADPAPIDPPIAPAVPTPPAPPTVVRPRNARGAMGKEVIVEKRGGRRGKLRLTSWTADAPAAAVAAPAAPVPQPVPPPQPAPVAEAPEPGPKRRQNAATTVKEAKAPAVVASAAPAVRPATPAAAQRLAGDLVREFVLPHAVPPARPPVNAEDPKILGRIEKRTHTLMKTFATINDVEFQHLIWDGLEVVCRYYRIPWEPSISAKDGGASAPDLVPVTWAEGKATLVSTSFGPGRITLPPHHDVSPDDPKPSARLSRRTWMAMKLFCLEHGCEMQDFFILAAEIACHHYGIPWQPSVNTSTRGKARDEEAA